VLEFFGRRLLEAAPGAGPVSSIVRAAERLGRVRLAFWVHARLAWEEISAFRLEHGMEVVDYPLQTPEKGAVDWRRDMS
jgi:hypothetical protein